MAVHPQMSLTDFVEIVNRSGTPKATKVRQVKERPDYKPAFDYYKSLREGIVETHKAGNGRKQFNALPGFSSDPKKQTNFQTLRKAYSKWWGKKTFKWTQPPRDSYLNSTVEIFVNPELSLEWGGKNHLIKLYFKESKLTKHRADLILDLMEHSLRPKISPQTEVCILDIRRSKLRCRPPGPTTNIPMVNAEIAYIESLWGSI